MQRLSLIIICVVALFINACDKKQEPSPPAGDEISSMSVSARKVNGEVILDITATTFKGTNPVATTFEQAEVWVSEEASGYSNMKLVSTTNSKTLKLDNLKADKTYYVAVKGIKNGVKTEFSKQIMFTTSTIKPLETLLELQNGWFISSSPTSPYIAYVDDGTGEVILQNWKDKTRKVIFKNSASKSYRIKGFYTEGARLFLETTRGQDRAFDYYDLANEKIIEIKMPIASRIWNCAFSPNGYRMAFTDYNSTGLFLYDTVLENLRVYSNDTFHDFQWTVDGKNIIEVRNKANSTLETREVVKWDLADSKKTPAKLFEWPDAIQSVLFSPNDEYVLFASSVANNSDLWIYELKSGKTWQISDTSNFGWLSEKEFFVNVNKTGNETSWKTYRYTMP
ncbi:WD40 repeat domain-containing protein [Emticicia sp. C21]|uniref:WD40 repeat domain-containing protein n=1 Tax=Emticicia sp. C21 TaxID=2302915 RepID=UPI000E351246|nr:WD40 repeat domain-containing protein [Emticicia sp. C21]RFS16197.1 WD40 repeat domain-containing protein [Emticicia sp. C21]